MRPGAGKNKGSQFERDIGAKLSLWLSGGQRKDLLRRTVGSGAQFTACFKKGIMEGVPGDLTAAHPLAFEFCEKYVVECKFWRDLDFLNFLQRKGGKQSLYYAMKKVRKEAEDSGKKWMLIVKQNHRPELLLMGVTATFSAFTTPWCPYHLLFGGTVILNILDEFLEIMVPETFLTS